MVPTRRLRFVVLVGIAALAGTLPLLPGPLAAQTVPLRPLEPEHWSYDFLELADALGHERAWHPWHAPVLGGVVDEALNPSAGDGEAEAPRSGAPRSPALARWSDLLEAELGSGRARAGRGLPGLLAVEGGFEDSRARLAGDRDAFGSARAEAWVTPWMTLWAEAGAAGDRDLSLRTGGAALRLGWLQLLAGRIRPALGQGLVRPMLSGRVEVDGVWVGSARPTRIPGLDVLGPVAGHVFAGPGLSTPLVGDAWFGTMHLSVEPHPAVRIGFTRTSRFFADGLEDEPSAGDLLRVFLSLTETDAVDDGQGEANVRVRWELSGQPLATYVTIGFEDKVAIVEDPALVLGTLVPVELDPGILTLRYEYAGFGERGDWCPVCDTVFHAWYQHPVYGEYTVEGAPLGARLGGYGAAHQLQLQFWAREVPLRAELLLFHEDRERLNILARRWPGVRKGIRVALAARPLDRMEVSGNLLLTSTKTDDENGFAISLRFLDIFGSLPP